MAHRLSEEKKTLVHELFANGRQTESAGDQPPPAPPSAGDRVVRVLMGFTLFAIGVVATGMGLRGVLTLREDAHLVAVSLVFVGTVFCQAAAALIQHFGNPCRWLGKVAYCACFLVSACLTVVGLYFAFDLPGSGLYLVMIGFGSAVIAALAMK